MKKTDKVPILTDCLLVQTGNKDVSRLIPQDCERNEEMKQGGGREDSGRHRVKGSPGVHGQDSGLWEGRPSLTPGPGPAGGNPEEAWPMQGHGKVRETGLHQ